MNQSIQPLAPLSAEAVHDRIWQELTRSTVDRHHEWRTPVLASIGLDGTPQARVVVLRQALKVTQSLTIFTDSRTPKVAELKAQPVGMLTFWSKRLNWQCRIALSFQVHTDGPEVETAWERMSKSMAAKDYLATVAPGSPFNGSDSNQNAEANNIPHNLCLLSGQISAIDWLELGHLAHRRIKFRPDGWQEVVA